MTESEKKKMRAKAAKLSNPKPRELPSGAWRCEVMVNGQRVSFVDEDPTVAYAKAVAVKNGLIKQTKNPSTLTVGEAIDRYIESKNSVLAISTIAGYEKIKRNQFKEIENVKLSSMTRESIQRWVNNLSKTLSPKTVKNAHGLLTAVLGAYLPDLNVNTTLPQKQRTEIVVPTEYDIRLIVTAAQGTEYELYILLAIWMGLRMSEIRGLRWDHIKGNVMRIRRAKVDQGDKVTKTFTSQRDLPIPDRIMKLLEEAPHTSEYVVPQSRHYIYENFQKLCKRAGVSQHYRFHDLRHINASIMLKEHIPNKYAQERMGHATEHMLKTVYQHTMKEETEKVNETVDNYFKALLD